MVKQALGADNSFYLCAILGCDTMSRLYGISKNASLKKYTKLQVLHNQAGTFNEPEGEKVLDSLYNGKATNGINALRYKIFCDQVAVKGFT